MTTLFISDLHLDAERPAVTELFGAFMQKEATRADALYILGDLFEAWVGDDDPSETGAYVAARIREVADAVAVALRELTDAGVPVFFIRGNRDFLLGQDYAQRAGMRILPDPCVITLYGKPVLLQHGDLLCTDDTAYQAFRAQTRDPAFIAQFLSQPLEARIAFAQKARAASQARQSEMKEDDRAQFETVTDVAPDEVLATFRRYGVDTMIHGHTHRPAVHNVQVSDATCTRIVLGDWYEQGSVLRVDADGYRLDALG